MVVRRGRIPRVWEPPGCRAPVPRQGLPGHGLPCPWLPSQGRTLPGLLGHRGQAGVKDRWGAPTAQAPLSSSPAARGRASRTRLRAGALQRVNGGGRQAWGGVGPDLAGPWSSSLGMRASWAWPAQPHTSCVALGRGLPMRCARASGRGGEAALQAALVALGGGGWGWPPSLKGAEPPGAPSWHSPTRGSRVLTCEMDSHAVCLSGMLEGCEVGGAAAGGAAWDTQWDGKGLSPPTRPERVKGGPGLHVPENRSGGGGGEAGGRGRPTGALTFL